MDLGRWGKWKELEILGAWMDTQAGKRRGGVEGWISL